MKYIKNIMIVIGFWLIGILIAMGVTLTLDLQPSLADSFIRDFSIGIMFLFIGWYYKKYYYYLGTIIMLLVAYGQISNSEVKLQKQVSNEVPIQEIIENVAANLNKKTPLVIDSETRLDSAKALPNILKYFYTMTSFTKSEIDEGYLKGTFVSNLKKRTCTNPELKMLFENNVSIIYEYKDKNALHIIGIEVTPNDCKNI